MCVAIFRFSRYPQAIKTFARHRPFGGYTSVRQDYAQGYEPVSTDYYRGHIRQTIQSPDRLLYTKPQKDYTKPLNIRQNPKILDKAPKD